MRSIIVNHSEKEEGFTLVELLIVILIIGILSAIAIPAFLNQRKSASEASVKADLKSAATAFETALVAQKAYPTDIPATVKTSDGVTLNVADGKSYQTIAMKASSTDSASNIKWGIDKTRVFYNQYYKDGVAVPSIYYTLKLYCNGDLRMVSSQYLARKISSDPSLLAQNTLAIDYSQCYGGTDIRVTVEPRDVMSFDPIKTSPRSDFSLFTLTKNLEDKEKATDTYCLQGYHQSDVANIWKYDSEAGGLQKGTC